MGWFVRWRGSDCVLKTNSFQLRTSSYLYVHGSTSFRQRANLYLVSKLHIICFEQLCGETWWCHCGCRVRCPAAWISYHLIRHVIRCVRRMRHVIGSVLGLRHVIRSDRETIRTGPTGESERCPHRQGIRTSNEFGPRQKDSGNCPH